MSGPTTVSVRVTGLRPGHHGFHLVSFLLLDILIYVLFFFLLSRCLTIDIICYSMNMATLPMDAFQLVWMDILYSVL